MKPITREQARSIVEQELSALPDDLVLVILDNSTIERPWGWVFFYTSSQYQHSGRLEDALFGNAPYLVNRTDGSIHSAGTSKPINHYIREYEAQLAAGITDPSPHKKPKRGFIGKFLGLK